MASILAPPAGTSEGSRESSEFEFVGKVNLKIYISGFAWL